MMCTIRCVCQRFSKIYLAKGLVSIVVDFMDKEVLIDLKSLRKGWAKIVSLEEEKNRLTMEIVTPHPNVAGFTATYRIEIDWKKREVRWAREEL